MLLRPYTGAPKTRRVLDPNLRRETFLGRMQYAPTRVRAKFGGSHISPHGYAKNAPDFTLPNRDTPKTRPILGANRRRETFRGVCNTPLHGYMKNLAGFIHPHTDTLKTHPILDPTPCRRTFRGVCFCALHGYVQNLVGFRRKPLARLFGGVCFCAPTRVRAKFGGFWTLSHDMARNPVGFGLCHTTWRETRRVLDFATRHGAKPGGFWTLPLDMAQNSAGFGLCHSTWRKTRRVFHIATRHSAKPGGFFTLPHV